MNWITCAARVLGVLSVLWVGANISFADVIHDAANKSVTMSDAGKNLVLRLNYDGKCLLDRVQVHGRNVVPATTGGCTGIQVAGRWHTTRTATAPKVTVTGNSVVVKDIVLADGSVKLGETWTFTVNADAIVWRIEREYRTGGTLDDTYFPGFDFQDGAWTGALLGTGGVAWFKLFDTPVASYGVHTNLVTFWNKDNNSCLRLKSTTAADRHLAVRFSRHPHDVISCNYSATKDELRPKHEQFRFHRDRQDVWAPFSISPDRTAVELEIAALDYGKAYGRGNLPGIGEPVVREIANTIARLGVIDKNVIGTNGWYSGFAVLQEPWIAQLGLLIDDPCYFGAYADTLDYQRERAVAPDGRVKPRWFYNANDAMPGTFDKFGFYECQWGWMLDSQPAFVTNVAEQFDFTGDLAWVRRQKETCEKALDFLLARDSNGNGLVEMMTDSHKQQKGCDWIDIAWASFENGLVNAEMYSAMVHWADVEELLGDSAMAAKYRKCAKRLKESFNRVTTEGGLWDAQRKCYVHWRDKDGSIHGTNLVTPVNFMAIAYAICDDPARQAAILDQIEEQMQRERLFIWPLCMTSYEPEEGGGGPFPTYENGDIFLAWGEVGIRAYANYKPKVAVRCVKNVLEQYAKDGLAFQRYRRETQTGEGADILSNMANPLVGLYRNIYGIQPKWNRLYLEPHLTSELAGATLRFLLRGGEYRIELKPEDYAITASKFTIRESRPFAVDIKDDTLIYFSGDHDKPSLSLARSANDAVEVRLESWPADGHGARKWTVAWKSASKMEIRQVIDDLPFGTNWDVLCNGRKLKSLQGGGDKTISFVPPGDQATTVTFEIQPVTP